MRRGARSGAGAHMLLLLLLPRIRSITLIIIAIAAIISDDCGGGAPGHAALAYKINPDVPSLAQKSYWLSDLCRSTVIGTKASLKDPYKGRYPPYTFAQLKTSQHECAAKVIKSSIAYAERFCWVTTADCDPRNFSAPYRDPIVEEKKFRTRFANTSFLDIAKGSWGTCALIAPGSSVLGAGQGKEIDGHDTVVRIQAQNMDPEWAKDIGTRTDVLITRAKANYSYKKKADVKFGYGDQLRLIIGDPDFYGRYEDVPRVKVTFWDKPPMKLLEQSLSLKWTLETCSRADDRIVKTGVRNLENIVYRVGTKFDKYHQTKASNGLKYYLGLVWSGFCTRVDLYGFSYSNFGGGSVYDARHKIKRKHHMDIEGWISRHLMKHYSGETNLCVYT